MALLPPTAEQDLSYSLQLPRPGGVLGSTILVGLGCNRGVPLASMAGAWSSCGDSPATQLLVPA